jgi:uncharacterized membrane protein
MQMIRVAPQSAQCLAMGYALLKTLHLLAVIVWVGGMVFSHHFLRPALATLEPPQRLTLMHAVLGRFFRAVLVASLTVVASGLWMIGHVAVREARIGERFHLPLDTWFMVVLGTLMLAIFGHVRYVLYRRLSAAVQGQQWPAAGAALNGIRQRLAVNLWLGVVIVAVVVFF